MAITYRTLPVPAFVEHTAMVPAGAVTIGVEYRHLDEEVILRFYGPDARAKFDNVAPAGMTGVDDPYEAPDAADLVVPGDRMPADEAAAAIVEVLIARGVVPESGRRTEPSREG